MDPTVTASTGRERVLAAARRLFAEQGVSGTSLSMIAAAMGVTKAAVYHQFPKKADIVLAVIEPVVDELDGIVTEAERQDTAAARFRVAVQGLSRLAVEHRGLAAAMYRDPVIASTLEGHERYQTQIRRLNRLLVGSRPTQEARITLALAGRAVMAAGIDPDLAQVDDAVLQRSLERAVLRLLEPHAPVPPSPAA